MFPVTSRYHGLPVAVTELPDGRKVSYVRRRFVPRPETLVRIGEHTVRPAQRHDHVADEVFGDAEQGWQLADANRAMDLDELTAEVGRRLRVTRPGAPPVPEPEAVQPGGVPGVPGLPGAPLALPPGFPKAFGRG
ncbi:LysM domain-containing protein [Amycolatopsis suaedae]|uniref:LysM domain-containing protein n=1 Tax=Amycolatopsis suaedae TaxID=2510978 RepID=UPI00196B7D29|nr:LysM domain-containing protein [Amycolatopsis suaedae]